ncbi:unnamed protein product [Diamesa serratosioi]
MCRCCQSCLEDLYWMCFEEKYGFDKNIANYDPTEDEYYTKNGHVLTSETAANSNEPIMNQPASRLQRNISVNSAKCHQEESRREIQQNVMLAPEILKVFENSQMFNECKQPVKPSSPQPATFSIGSSRDDKSITELKNEMGSKLLLERLNEEDDSVDAKSTPIIICDHVDGVLLRPKLQRQTSTSNTDIWPSKIVNKNLKNLSLDAPYFTQRPASENDIFTITKGGITETIDRINVLSLTPEVPSISFSHLPKNYLDTPTIDKYKESPSLLSIQTAEIRSSMTDFSMPRYYRKSDMILNKNLEAIGSNLSIASTSSQPKTHVEKSKRLKTLRTHLPPLMINSNEKFEKAK